MGNDDPSSGSQAFPTHTHTTHVRSRSERFNKLARFDTLRAA